MNTYKLLLLALFSILMLGACKETEQEVFDLSKSYVAFSEKSYRIIENIDEPFEIMVGASGWLDGDLTVDFEFYVHDEVEGIGAAVEGKDFILLNPTKTLRFKNGVGYEPIKLQLVDDALKNGNRKIEVKLMNPSQAYALGFDGARSFASLLIIDDESQSKFAGVWRIVKSKSIWVQKPNGDMDTEFDINADNTLDLPEYEVVVTIHPTEAGVLTVSGLFGFEWLSAKLVADEATGEVKMLTGFLCNLPDEYNITMPIYLYSIDAAGNAGMDNPVVGKVENSTTLEFYRYVVMKVDSDGELDLLLRRTAVLKETWIKVKDY